MTSPDQHARGFLRHSPRSDRYENVSIDPLDVAFMLAALIPAGVKVLDVGCGTGSVSASIRMLANVELIGIEPDAERANLARARGLVVYDGYLNESFLLDHGPFQTIIFSDVLEHLSDPQSMVLLARKGLEPGGAIVVSVPNVAHWFVRYDLL